MNLKNSINNSNSIQVFEIKKEAAEFSQKEKSNIGSGCTVHSSNSHDPIIIATFSTKEEALKHLKKFNSKIETFRSPTGLIYRVTEYYIEVNEYNEDGEWINGGNIWEFSAFPCVLNHDELIQF